MSTPISDPDDITGHAFISYVREDLPKIEALQQHLEAAGIKVWRDTADLWPGEDWRVKVRQAITTNAFVFLACFSASSLAREVSYQNEELVLAVEQLRLRRQGELWLIPVRLDDSSIPDINIGGGHSLASIQRVDLFGRHYEEEAVKLSAAVRRILDRGIANRSGAAARRRRTVRRRALQFVVAVALAAVLLALDRELLAPRAVTLITPTRVAAVALSQYTVRVTWTEKSRQITGFSIDNGCPAGSCSPGAMLAQTTGPSPVAYFQVSPGSYQCFRVRALDGTQASLWSAYGCVMTRGYVVPADQVWPDTGVYLKSGEALKLTAHGTVRVNGRQPEGPTGDVTCVPSKKYPAVSPAFLAPDLPCWELIARIGNSAPFAVGASSIVSASAGYLYLSINDNEFARNTGSWIVDIKIGG
jgi:hypothetical protein